jgi:leader peptidase (prepilin peptidase)/N-methyltransferase
VEESVNIFYELPFWFQACVVFLFGAIWGSFLNVCIYRLPLNLSIVTPASRCGRCKTRIALRDNLPIIGYFLVQGRCRFCGQPFSVRYAMVELLTACMSLLLYCHWSLHWQYWFMFIFGAAMVVVTFIDIDHRIIPDSISIGGTILGVVLAFIMPVWVANWFVTPVGSLLGILTGAGALLFVSYAYKLLTGVEGIGLGDVKLLACIGAWFGWQTALLTIFISSFVGSIFGLLLMVIYRRSSKFPIPFGPFIVVGCLWLIWAEPLWLKIFIGDFLSR